MDAVRLGNVCRALRIKKRWRQLDLAHRAGVSRTAVSDIENGHIARLRVDAVLRVIDSLGGRIDFVVRWHGADLDRLLNARHSALHESVARMFGSLDGWEIAPEASFSIAGERGVIDILAWHAASRTVLVIELKTDIVDVNELMGTLGRKRRLARAVARSRGWPVQHVAVWLIVADSVTNRRRVAAHATTLRASLALDGRSIKAWLRSPSGEVGCLSFWSNAVAAGTKPTFASVRRVRPRAAGAAERGHKRDAAGTAGRMAVDRT